MRTPAWVLSGLIWGGGLALASCGGDAGGGVDAATDAPRPIQLLYLNRDGGTFSPGPLDSVSDTIPFISLEATLPPYPHSEVAWELTRDCVRELFAPFRVDVVEVDPGPVDHLEIVVTTTPDTIGWPSVPSVASVPLQCELRPRALGLVFAGEFRETEWRQVCEEIAAVAGINYTLDWTTYDCDVMSVGDSCGDKAFTSTLAPCLNGSCFCGDQTQASRSVLIRTVGLR